MQETLNQTTILSRLNPNIILDHFTIYDTIPSTNDALYEYLKNNPQKNAVFLSEEQTAGKGRVGKNWHSPKYQNIYLSMSCHFQQPVHQLQDLSILVGKGLIKMLRALNIGPQLKLKYPNDILYDDKKLAGILVETFSPAPETTSVVIGIGLNVHLQQDEQKIIDQPWTSLDLITHSLNDRNEIAAQIINALQALLNKSGF